MWITSVAFLIFFWYQLPWVKEILIVNVALVGAWIRGAVPGHSGAIRRWEGGAGSNKDTKDLVGVTVKDRCRPSSRKRQEGNTYWISLWRDFRVGPVVKTSPSSAGSAGLIPSQRAKIAHGSWPNNPNIKQKQYCHKFKKDFKSGPQQKKKKALKNKFMESETKPILRITCSGKKPFCSCLFYKYLGQRGLPWGLALFQVYISEIPNQINRHMLVKQLMVICNCVLWAVILNCRVEAFSIRINYLWCLCKLYDSTAPPVSCQRSGPHQCLGHHCFHSGFLHLGALDIWSWVICHHGDCPVIPSLYSLDASCTPLPQFWPANISPGICKCPLRDSLSLLGTSSLVVPLLI